jgi:vacuolar-type H+-ATPase subunit H
MLRFQYYGPVVLALAAAACQKSAQEERSEAINAQKEANQTARVAADDRIKEVTQANREASKDIAHAQNEASKDIAHAQNEASKDIASAQGEASKDIAHAEGEANETARKAAKDEAEKTADAQRKANAETREAVDATRKDQADLRKSVEAKLNKLDERVRDLTKEANGAKVAPAVATNARQQLTAVEAEIKSLRTELPQLQADTAPGVEQFKARADQRVAKIEKTLDQVDDQL